MRSQWRLRPFTPLAIAALVGVAWTASGCGSNKELIRKDEEIARLKRMNALAERTLEEKLGTLERLQTRVRALEAEKEAAKARIASLEAELEKERSRAATLESKAAELEKELEDARVAYQRLSNEHARVKDVASATANELAELRLKRQELLERAGVLSRENVGLRQENLRLSREIDQLRSELVKERAALRAQSLQKGAVAREVEERLKALEEENRTLREEKAGLLARLEGLQAASAAAAGSAQTGTSAPREPKAVFGEAASVAAKRVGRMVRGKAEWDGADLAIAVAAVLALAVLVWFITAPLRWRRRRKMRQQLKALRRRVHELEEGGVEPQGRRRVRRAPPRAGVVRRSQQFSPILSAPEGEEEPEMEASWDEAEETLDAAQEPEGGAFDTEREEAPQPVGTSRAEEEEEEEDFADQMVTVSLGAPVDLEEPAEEETPRPRSQADEPAGEFEDDFAHTQVIGGFDLLEDEDEHGGDSGGGKGKKRRRGQGGGDQELLSELKDMIGEKFDEYLR